MKKDQIVVVGGYGSVGQKICQRLSEVFPDQVYAAGRSLVRAEQFSRNTKGKVKPLQWDIQQHPARVTEDSTTTFDASVDPHIQAQFEELYQWSTVKVVIMCLDQNDTTWVKYCLSAGIHYIDISAKDSFLYLLEQWNSASWQATALLGVGLAPGLTNLLAQHVYTPLDHIHQLELSVLLGLGEHHGQAAIEWTVDQMSTSFPVKKQGEWSEVDSFTEGRTVSFGKALPFQKVYRFPFSDQQALARTTDIPTISTRLGFDSSGITRMIAGLQKVGFFRLLSISWIRQAIISLFNHIHLGSERYGIKAEATGLYKGQSVTVSGWLTGYNQSTITAEVTAIVAEMVYTSKMNNGIYHIHQQIDWNDIINRLQKRVNIEWGIDNDAINRTEL
ncbi:saccharopine dehydrogenase family protein [Paenibacillus nicotianae]|uniref:Saccharopine dehydrogenase family protein n=1 Tax=Paenibacillus nicotianae TaxID=1526551 RepID=A0ABW4US55_9BACL